MIELTAHESALLLITKYWEHKDVLFERDDLGRITNQLSKEEYVQKVCNYMYFGKADLSGYPYKADIWAIYSSLGEKLLTTKNMFDIIGRTKGFSCYSLSMIESLIVELTMLKVVDNIKLNYDLVVQEGKEHFIYDKEQCIAISLFKNGIKPNFSSDITESISCGYGELDNNGFWEFPLPEKFWLKND